MDHNLSGGYLDTAQSVLNSYVRGGEQIIEAQVFPKTKVAVGDAIIVDRGDQTSVFVFTISDVSERRPCRGNWKDTPMDWLRMIVKAGRN